MNQINFIIILIIILVFFKFNIDYKKHHEDKSILEESNVKKTIGYMSLIDNLFRIGSDASVIAI
jgi:hypothetical protein